MKKTPLADLSNYWSIDYYKECCNSGKPEMTYDDWWTWAIEDPWNVIHPEDRKVLQQLPSTATKKLLAYANGIHPDSKNRNLYPTIPHAFLGNVFEPQKLKLAVLGINPRFRLAPKESAKRVYENIAKPVDKVIFEFQMTGDPVYPWSIDSEFDDFRWHKRFSECRLYEAGIDVRNDEIIQIEMFPYPSYNGLKDLDRGLKSELPLPSQEVAKRAIEYLLRECPSLVFFATGSVRRFVKDNLDNNLAKEFDGRVLVSKIGPLPATIKASSFKRGDDWEKDGNRFCKLDKTRQKEITEHVEQLFRRLK